MLIMTAITYQFRLYPSKKQKERLIDNFKICKEVYNTLLDLNKKLWTTKKFDFNSLIMDLKCCNPEIKKVHSQVLQNVSDRVSKAFDNFFRRLKNKDKEKGYPRFKSKINSITYPQSGFKFMNNKKLRISKMGNIPIVLHRAPKGNIKTMTIKVNKLGEWSAYFSCETPEIEIKHSSDKFVGIDMGVESFAILSNGKQIENPKYLIKSEEKLKKLQRKFSRKKLRSNNWRKAKFNLTGAHLKIANQRADFLHKVSSKIANKYSFIAVENLSIKNMVKNHHLAKSISDVSWGNFVKMLSYKAVKSGGMLIKVNPRNTSKTCSECGAIIEMPLSKREFNCLECGFVCHRDLNASLNILGQGMSEFKPVGDIVRPSLKAVVCESGTICGELLE